MENQKDFSEDDLDEEDYEEILQPLQETGICRVLDLKFMENLNFSLIIDEDSDTLLSIRRSLNPQRRQTLGLKESFIIDQRQEIRFSYTKDQEVHYISIQDEALTIHELILEHGLHNMVQNEKLVIFLNKEEIPIPKQQIDPNEVLRETVKVYYSVASQQENRTLIGKLDPKAEIYILNNAGEEEWSFKVNEVTVEDVGLKKLQFTYDKIDAQFAKILIEFPSNQAKLSSLMTLQTILKLEKLTLPAELSGSSRHYQVKKVNRYGIKQKRQIWFNFDDSTFNICTNAQKNHKDFSIRFIKKFVTKVNTSNLFIEFYKEINAKNLSLVFFNDGELNEFLELAQKMQKSLRESKFQCKQSVIFAQDVAGLKDKRKFTWLNPAVQDVEKTEDAYFNYKVLVLGKVSQEKRYLFIETIKNEAVLINKEKRIVRVFPIDSLCLRYYMEDPAKLELISPSGNTEVLFTSVYMKYHFCSQFFMLKFPERIKKTDGVEKIRVKVFVSTWNVGQQGEVNKQALEMLLGGAEGHEIVALGFQECSRGKMNVFLKELSVFFENKSYCLVSYISMWDMFIVAFTTSLLISSISDIKTVKKPTGVAGIIGNKGGLVLTFRLEDTSYCFVSCHLAARQNRMHIRNQNAKDLLALKPSLSYLEFPVEFDYTFWVGDLNYRIDYNFYDAITLIDQDNYSVLYDKDQLYTQVQSNKILSTFKEDLKCFKPTYRCLRKSSGWSNKREQTPSWTDRVLYRGYNEIECLAYQSMPNCFGSDHRPVYGSFLTSARVWHVPRNLPVIPEEIKLGVIEIQHLSIQYFEETQASHAMVTFYSPYIEGSPRSSQIVLGKDGTVKFEYENIPVLNFIFALPDILKELRVCLVFWLIVGDGDVSVCGNAGLKLEQVVEYIRSSPGVDCNGTFTTSSAIAFEEDLEFGSRIVGKLKGEWTYNICKKSDQYRF